MSSTRVWAAGAAVHQTPPGPAHATPVTESKDDSGLQLHETRYCNTRYINTSHCITTHFLRGRKNTLVGKPFFFGCKELEGWLVRDSDAYLPVPLLKVQISLVVSRRSTYHYLAHVP